MSPKKVTKPLDVYVRVSAVRGRGGESFASPELQEQTCRRIVEQRGLEVGRVFTDLDQSGGKMKRPGLDKAIARIESGESGGIVVAKIDRFARTLLGGLQTLEEIHEKGGVVIVADIGDGEPLNTASAQGELVLNMMLTLAQFELRRIRESWDAQKERAVMTRRIHVSKNCPPGYRREEVPNGVSAKTGNPRVKVVGPLEPHPVHAATLREAFEMAARGVPYARIADFLTERKFPSGGKAANWQPNRIGRLLSNRVYLGEARYGSITNAEAHEAIVTPEVWAAAQRKPKPMPVERATALLAGLARCEHCRYALRRSTAGRRVPSHENRPSARFTYEDRPGNRPGERCQHPAYISMQRLDEYVLEQWVERLRARGRGDQEGGAVQDDAAAVAARLAIEEARRALAEVEALRGAISPASFAMAHHDAVTALEEAEQAAPQPHVVDLDPDADPTDPLELFLLNVDWNEAGWDKLGFGTKRPLHELIPPDRIPALRRALARDIQAVFVRPATQRYNAHTPVSDRVSIVWAGEPAPELPKRGRRFENAEAQS